MSDKKFLDYSTAVLVALQRKHVYAGTVPWVVKQERRRKSKLARAARRLNR